MEDKRDYMMNEIGKLGSMLAGVCVLAIGPVGMAKESIADYLSKPSLNVVITVSDMAKAQQFYGEVLGLAPMSPIPFGEKTAEVFFPHPVVMQRYSVGTHEIKLLPGLDSTKKQPGGVAAGIGFRMVNFPIPDIEAFKERLKAHGYPEPQINAMPADSGSEVVGSTYRYGMLEDPDGNQVEFYFHEGEGPEGWRESIQIALTVSDVEASRRFYGETLGMQDLGSVPMPGGQGRKVHLFMNGPTMIKFWSMGPDLPVYSGRHDAAYGFRYIQYQTKNVGAAHEFVKSRGGRIAMPPTAVGSMPVDIMFVADPDGIINEMFGMSVGGR